MASLPIRDRDGNSMVDFHFGGDETVGPPVMPAALVVVSHADAVLMIFDSWREQWELPGGMREADETARQAAVRELYEETGIQAASLDFVAVAEFELVRPERRELLALYRLRLEAVPELTANDEALGFRWWAPGSPVDEDMSPLDAEMARRVFGC